MGIPHFRHTLHPPIRINADTAAILRCSKVVIWQVVFTCFHWFHVTVRPLEIWALSQPLYSSSVQILRRYDAEEFNKRVSKSSTQEPERYLNSSKHVQKYEALSSAKQNIQVKECVCVRVLVRCWFSHLTSYKHQPVPPWQVGSDDTESECPLSSLVPFHMTWLHMLMQMARCMLFCALCNILRSNETWKWKTMTVCIPKIQQIDVFPWATCFSCRWMVKQPLIFVGKTFKKICINYIQYYL